MELSRSRAYLPSKQKKRLTNHLIRHRPKARADYFNVGRRPQVCEFNNINMDTDTTSIAHQIQLSIAPVFLLSGIGAMLAVMTSRLGRIVDRSRVLEECAANNAGQVTAAIANELGVLYRRSKFISLSITLCTLTALLICAVIGALFLDGVLSFAFSGVVTTLFLTATGTFFLGLLMFLREVLLATHTVRIDLRGVSAALSQEVGSVRPGPKVIREQDIPAAVTTTPNQSVQPTPPKGG